MTLTQLRYLVAIADSGLNITLAAERVHATQPGLSKRLRQLEDELGFQLFVRRGKSLDAVTDAGQHVLERARIILAEAANIPAIAANLRNETHGELRIATTHTQARFALPAAIGALNRRYPQVSVHLQPGRDGEVLAQLEAGHVDLAVISTAGAPPPDRFAFALGSQLRRAAELISVRQALGLRRQIFFCSLGGFDTHDAQMADQPQLLAGLSRAVKAFHAASVELGVESDVTTFAATEFGRSLTSNGDGSDHGWGNHLFVLGGAVRGRRVFGAVPDLSPDSQDIAGDGNLIPRVAVDQYGATLGRWFGVPDDALDRVFPNLRAFDRRDLGFMA
jgi:DNA-binding transcriptional LysR family regulator